MSKRTNSQVQSNQEGIVAIIVAVILTALMSLIVLGISQNANREQRQALDRQLSDQAFYNAESGVNDVANYLYTNLTTTPAIPIEKKECLPEITTPAPGIDYTLNDPSNNNRYTCLLYDKAPKTIQYDSLSLSSPKVVPIQTVDDAGNPVNIASLTMSWDDSQDRDGSISGGCDFASDAPELPNTCGYGGLRAELVSFANDRESIRQRSLSAFLLPSTSAGSPISVSTYSAPAAQIDAKGIISPSGCNGPAGTRRCSKTITDINRNNLTLSLRSLYRPVSLTISGKDTNGVDLRFKDTQIVIDSTGRASDVLRRIQVRVPATSQYSYPGFSFQTKDSICKVLIATRIDNNPGDIRSAEPAPGPCPID